MMLTCAERVLKAVGVSRCTIAHKPPQGLPGFSKGWKWQSERRKLKLPSGGWLEASGSHVAPSKAQWAAAFPAHTVDYAALNSPPGQTTLCSPSSLNCIGTQKALTEHNQ